MRRLWRETRRGARAAAFAGCVLLFAAASGGAQSPLSEAGAKVLSRSITLSVSSELLGDVLTRLRRDMNVPLAWSGDVIPDGLKISLSVRAARLSRVCARRQPGEQGRVRARQPFAAGANDDGWGDAAPIAARRSAAAVLLMRAIGTVRAKTMTLGRLEGAIIQPDAKCTPSPITPCVITDTVIISFADHGTADIFEGIASPDARRTCPAVLWRVAVAQLERLDAADRLAALATPGGNRLEKLLGDRSGQWSIRINDQYRLCFQWEDNDAYEVEIVDYHR